MAVDLDVPARHGIRQSVGDSVGPGGISRALRNIPVLVGIGRDMEELCPDAWLLNITNPMTTLTRSVCRETSIKAVGLCHEVGNFELDLAIALRSRTPRCDPTVTGVNHFPVVTELRDRGPRRVRGDRRARRRARRARGARPRRHRRPRAHVEARLGRAQLPQAAMFERWGVIPAAGDRHLAEFVPSILTESPVGRRLGCRT